MTRGVKETRKPSMQRRALSLLERCRQVTGGGDVVALSAITLSELEHGAVKSDDYVVEMQTITRLLKPFKLFDFDTADCPNRYGKIRHQLESAGTPIGSMDLLLAAHALSLDATLVSQNLRHFSRVSGLRVENWLAA